MSAEGEFLPGIVGHAELREHLGRLVRHDSVPQGILLAGSRGRGKRTLALAFARALLAPDPFASPSGRTPPDLEVVERAAGTRQIPIDRVRALRETFSLTPVEAPARVAVVVDAERLTTEAGNALLKLLEEPPPGACLVLTARDREAVMETLVSRCRVFRVGPVPAAAVADFLAARGLTGERAPWLARLAEGSPGLALELAADDGGEGLAGRLATLFVPDGHPLDRAGDLVRAARKDAEKVEIARERLLNLLDAATFELRQSLGRALGAAREGPRAHEEVRAVLDARSPRGLERALARVLATRQGLARNVSPEGLFEDLVAELDRGDS